MKIGIIGAGNMGGAIARGLLDSKTILPTDIVVTDPSQSTLDHIKAQYPDIATSTTNRIATVGTDVIIIAVKPWLVASVINEIAPFIAFREQSIVSIAAGITISDLSDMLKSYSSHRTLFRVIPNTAIAIGQSMTFISHDNASDKQLEHVIKTFGALGHVAEIEERLMPAATALCSCGIAYAMRYVRAATEGGVELGIYPDKAKEYVLQTLRGAIELLESTGNHPEAEIDKVTTPGGITIKGLNAMEANGFTCAVINGLKASV